MERGVTGISLSAVVAALMTGVTQILLANQPAEAHTSVNLAEKATNTASVGAPASREAGAFIIDEIIVTAQKRQERLQDVPMTVTAITGDQLKNQGAQDIKDVLGSVPGLSYSGQERGLSNYSIRGVTNSGTAPTVGIYLDDIAMVTTPQTFSGAFDPVFFDVARVEVLKGPQGTFYGGSAMGGAIKYVSALPDVTRSSGYVSAGLGTTAHGSLSYNAEGVANLPIIADTLAFRGGISYRHEGGFIDNVSSANLQNITVSSKPSPVYTPFEQSSLSPWTEKDFNHADTYIGRVSFLWTPDATWSIRPSAYFQGYKAANPDRYWPNLSGLKTSFRLSQPTTDQDGIYSVDARKAFDSVDVTSLTAYYVRKMKWKRDYSYLIGGFIPPIFAISDSLASYPSDVKTLSQELRVSSKEGAESRLKWLAGFYYSTQRDQANPLVTSTNAGFENNIAFVSDQLHYTDQYAIFADATYEITEKLELTAGARVFQIHQHTSTVSDGPFNGGFSKTYGTSNENGVSPRLVVSYKPAEDHVVYASASRGFRPGGPNFVPSSCNADLAQLGYSGAQKSYKSDNIISYEAGLKNEFQNHQILNAALFYSNWKDIQQSGPSLACGFGFTTNAGRATIKGVELESQVELARSFRVGASASFTDAQLAEALLGNVARAGDQIEAAPKWTGSVDGSYSTVLRGDWTLEARAEYEYRSRQRLSYARTQGITFSDGVGGVIYNPGQFEKGYGTASMSSTVTNGVTTLRLFINNLFDAHPLLDDADVGQGYRYAQALRPRTIGLNIQQNF